MMPDSQPQNAPWYATIVSRIAVDVPVLLLAAYGFHLQSTGIIGEMQVIADKIERLTLTLETLRYGGVPPGPR